MSNAKEVGIIGQKYEDRTSGKTGVLESRDEKCKTLMMIDDDGKGFNVSYSSFKSRWRKFAGETQIVEEKKEKKAVAKEVVVGPIEEVSDADAIKSFNSSNDAQIIEREDGYVFVKDDFEVMQVKKYKDGSYRVDCLPDVYIDSEDLKDNVTDFKCSRTVSGLDLSLKVRRMSFAALVNAVKDAIVDINLYAYVAD